VKLQLPSRRTRGGAPRRAAAPLSHVVALVAAALVAALAPLGCDRGARPAADSAAVTSNAPAPTPPPEADEPAPVFRNVAERTEYVGDAACAGCHADAAAAYAGHSMANSFHRWTAAGRLEPRLDTSIAHPRSGLRYAVAEDSGRLYQVEYVDGPGGRRLHELRRRIDWVTGSGRVARTYFTEENGRLFQLPLTWYRDHGWDFSPGYQGTNPRFERMLPDRCVACHASYPRPMARLEGKYAELRPGIGCERCHGAGALHARTWRAAAPAARQAALRDTARADLTIVNPARLPLERRLDVCEQCHVHTEVTVPREGRGAFDYQPSQPLRDQFAFFRASGSIDLVSHADRLRQSACFVAARKSSRPLECATCHNPHEAPVAGGAAGQAERTVNAARNQPCVGCHAAGALAAKVAPAARAQHAPGADCVTCHMPAVKEHSLPHGSFTDHWIRVPGRATRPSAPASGPVARYVAAYYARDRAGPEAAVYQGMGAVVYASLANNTAALRAGAATLEQALRGTPVAAGPAGRPAAHMLLGVAFSQLGRVDDAVVALERAVRADSANPEALRALAQAYLLAGRPVTDAARLYERALAVQPRLAWLRGEYADLLEQQGQGARAVAEYRRAVAEQPSLAGAWFNLGTTLTGAGLTADATAAFAKAVQLDPTLGQALAPLVVVRTEGDRLADARPLGVQLASLPVRDRGPGALRVDAGVGPGGPAVMFANAPAGGVVRILRPDGTAVRTLVTGGPRQPVLWDLRSDAGRPVGGGLYRAWAQGQGAGGRPSPPQQVLFGVAREGTAAVAAVAPAR